MERLNYYLDKFSESGQRVLKGAFNEMRRRSQYQILPEHILYALIKEETDLFDSAMNNISIDPQAIRLAVEKRLENNPQHTGEDFRIVPETTEIFKFSMDRARSQGRRKIETSDIFYALTNNKINLLNDILQNPEGSVRTLNRNKISAEDSQKHFISRLQNEPSAFFIKFSLRESVNRNYSHSRMSSGGIGFGGSGGMLSGGNSAQTTNNKHESFSFRVKSPDSNEFDEAEFISSIKEDVEDSIKLSHLKITKTDSPNPSSFRFEYRKGKMNGRVEISGELTNEYYRLKTAIIEESNRKK
ncbi:MAG: Clp protease N-terminal domain-containing protein [Pyrinomonadaceae bacterium]